MKAAGAVGLLILVGAVSAGVVASLARAASAPSLPAVPAVAGSTEYSVKIGDLQGPRREGVHAGWFAASSFEPGVVMPTISHGRSVPGRLAFMMPTDGSASGLREAAASHTTFDTAAIECVDVSRHQTVVAARLHNVSVSSVEPAPDRGAFSSAAAPTERVGLSFSKLEWATPDDSQGASTQPSSDDDGQ